MLGEKDLSHYTDIAFKEWELEPICDRCNSPGPFKVVLPNALESGHSLVRCSCGLRFFSPRLSKAYIHGQCYPVDNMAFSAISCWENGTLTPGEVGDKDPEMFKRFRRSYYKQLYDRYLAMGKSKAPLVFEVGSNIGWFLKACLDGGADPASMGCEMSPTACEIGHREWGLNLWASPFEEYQEREGERYDLLLAMDYIEHTYTPCKDLAHLRRMARPGAVLILKTFLEELDIMQGRTMLAPPGHSHHFTGAVLKACLQEAGWRIVTEEISGVQATYFAEAGEPSKVASPGRVGP